MKELNEKLAKWAGFEQYIPDSEDTEWIFKPHPTYENIIVKGRRWITPDGTGAMLDLPNFTESLDACFKWLVPKLQEEFSWEVVLEMLQEWIKGFILYDRIPPESLCKAIEKLIDGEKDE